MHKQKSFISNFFIDWETNSGLSSFTWETNIYQVCCYTHGIDNNANIESQMLVHCWSMESHLSDTFLSLSLLWHISLPFLWHISLPLSLVSLRFLSPLLSPILSTMPPCSLTRPLFYLISLNCLRSDQGYFRSSQIMHRPYAVHSKMHLKANKMG